MFTIRMWIYLLLVSSMCAVTKTQGRVVCYFDSWSLTRTGDDQYRIEDIDPALCTHVIYAFADLASDGTIRVGDPSTDLPSGLDGYNRLQQLKQHSSHLKTLISVNALSPAVFSLVFNNNTLRAVFVNSTTKFVKEHGFDGLDVDWEYPAIGKGTSPTDKVAFAETLADLHNKFTPLGLLLTIACPSPSSYIRNSYDVSSIVRNVDFINLMTYDFHDTQESTTGLNAPLFEREADYNKGLNVNAGVENWLNSGAPVEKIILGMGFFGTTFILTNVSDNGVGAPALGPTAGTRVSLRYNQICESQMKHHNWNINWDDEAKVPFANREELWVSYDDPESITYKARYVREMKLGGAMVWSLDMDDFKGTCSDKNILLQKINDYIS